MPVSFPALKPASRTFAAPEFPVTVYRAQSGGTTRRLWATEASNAILRLSFNNLTDSDSQSILTAYKNAKGNFLDLTLPDQLFDGASTSLKAAIIGTNLIWRFAEGTSPTVESTFPGRSRVDVTLVGTI